MRSISGLFVQLSEALRLSGTTLPAALEARVPVLEREFKIEGQVLRDLLALKRNTQRFSEAEAVRWHHRLFPVVDAALIWIETHWPVK